MQYYIRVKKTASIGSDNTPIFSPFPFRDTFETGLLQLHINVTVPKVNDNITKTSAAIYNVKLKIGKIHALKI